MHRERVDSLQKTFFTKPHTTGTIAFRCTRTGAREGKGLPPTTGTNQLMGYSSELRMSSASLPARLATGPNERE